MAKKLVMVLCCGLVLAGLAWAQDGGQKPGVDSGWKQPTPEQQAANMVAGLEKRVGGLTAEQKAKATEIYLKQLTDTAAIRSDAALTPKQKSEKLAVVYKTAQEAINALLSPEQKAKMPSLPRPQVQGKEGDRLFVTDN